MKMKKVLFIMGMSLTVSGLFAQGGTAPASSSGTITDKKGEVYLPQAGDWAISMDATPWLNYFGNFFHGGATPNVAPTAAFLNGNNTLVGKYFVDDHTAYRALLRLGFSSYSQNNEIQGSDLSDSIFPYTQVEDKRSISSHFIGVGGGMEKRRGNGRLQGYYGAEIMFFIAGSDTTYTYGNPYNSVTNANPTYTNWNNPGGPTNVFGLGAGRLTDNQPGSTFGVGLIGFIGFEYFFAPKISIGGEYTWGFGFQSTSQGSFTREELNPTTNADETNTYKTGGSSGFSLDNGLNQAFGSGTGSLYINFHF
jgi:hypothetical protein